MHTGPEGGGALTELIYRLDERLKSLDQNMSEIKADVKEIKSNVQSHGERITAAETKLNETDGEVKLVKRISWTAVVGAVVSFITGK